MDNTYLQEMRTRYGRLLYRIMEESPTMDRNGVIERVISHFDTLYHEDIELLAGDDENLRNEYYYMFEDYAGLYNGVKIPYYNKYKEMLESEKQRLGGSISDDAIEQLIIERFLTSNHLENISDSDLMDPDECLRKFSNDAEKFDDYYNGKVMPYLKTMMEDTVAELTNLKNQEETQVYPTMPSMPRIPLHAWGAFARAIRDQKPETPEQEQAIWNQLVANNFGVLKDKKLTYTECVNHANPIKVKKTWKKKLAEKFATSKVGRFVHAVAKHVPVVGKKIRTKEKQNLKNPVNPTNEVPPIPTMPVDPLTDLKNNIHITKEAVDRLEFTDTRLNSYITWYRNDKEGFLRSKKELQDKIAVNDKKKAKLRQDETFYKKEINTYHGWMQQGADAIERLINSPASFEKIKTGKKAAGNETILVVMPTIDNKILDKKQYDQYIEKGYMIVQKPLDMVLKEAGASVNVINQENYISRLSSFQAVQKERAKIVEEGEILRTDLNVSGKAEGIVRQEEAIQEMKEEQERKARQQVEREEVAKREAAERAKAELEAQHKRDEMGFYQRQAERNYTFPTETANAESLSNQFKKWKDDKDIAFGVPKKSELTKVQEERIQRNLEEKRTPTLQPSVEVVPEPVAVEPDPIIVEPITLEESFDQTVGKVESGTPQFIDNSSTIERGAESPVVEEPSVVKPTLSDKEIWAADRLRNEKSRRKHAAEYKKDFEEIAQAAAKISGFTPKERPSTEVVASPIETPVVAEEPKVFASSHTSIEGTMSPVQPVTEMNVGRTR